LISPKLKQVQELFHGLIRARTRGNGVKVPRNLPKITTTNDTSEEPTWFSIAGMYGGFSYWIEFENGEPRLHTKNWCRIVVGSGQYHIITPEEIRLVDDRFTANAETMKIFHSSEDINKFNKDWTIHWAKQNGFDVIHEKNDLVLCGMHGTDQYFAVAEDGSWEAFGMKPEGERITGDRSQMLQIYLRMPEEYQELMKNVSAQFSA
jgi:hypothetical protein